MKIVVRIIRKIYFWIFYPIQSPQLKLRWKLRLLSKAQRLSSKRLAWIVCNRIQATTGCHLSPQLKIPSTVAFPHPTGIVIGGGVCLGERVKIFQNVTLGGARIGDAKESKYPEIGEGTVIFAGAVIVGKIKVGSNCIVGANSVVTRDLPNNCVAVGAPARIIEGGAEK
ncbi:serine acetyltransferase [Idiomarina baltica OS145]|uniref:Serine acetyltransferase n=1 Tax=Idiomarina baltica OS145 TaxID=314276 RepID=A0ABM9WLT4_9GAMM|nr:serine acetyltransferase [Idiomarina baltica OS145]